MVLPELEEPGLLGQTSVVDERPRTRRAPVRTDGPDLPCANVVAGATLSFSALLLALAVGAAGLGANLALRANDARRLHAELAVASEVALELETSYVNQAAAARAYFLSADPASLEQYTAERFHALDVSGRLQGLLLRTNLQPFLTTATDAGRVWRVEAIDPLVDLQRLGNPDAVIAGYRNGPAVRLFEETADALRALRGEVRSALGQAERDERSTRDNLQRFAIASAAAVIAAFVAIAIAARVWLSRPIARLGRWVRSDEPADQVFAAGGPSELKALASDVSALRARLLQELDLAARTREGLSQNAAVLMSLRTQLETSPENLPEGWSVSAQLVPAMGIVAGDCYDIDYLPTGGMAVLVVDVAGHGAGSAVVALRAKELLRAGLRSQPDPSAAIAWASQQLSDLEPDMFVTAFAAVVDFGSGLVRFVNAGHPPALLCDDTNSLELGPTGPLLGPFDGDWKTREAIIAPGQMLVCYTDGLVEVRDAHRHEFGMQRLRDVLRDGFAEDTDSVVKRTLNEVDRFGSGRAHDDITVAVVARAKSPA